LDSLNFKTAHYPFLDFHSGFAQTCYTSAAFELFASSGLDFQEGFPDLRLCRIQLALRQLNAEEDE
jgi:hypothetical protein